jgi:cytochrome b6-f complex iron-sulfur subunit
MTVSRRRFIDWFLATSVGALAASVLYPVVRFVSPPDVPEATTNQVEAGPVNDPDLMERGFKILRFGAEPVILIRVADGDFRAFAATCTHLDCIVEHRRQHGDIFCNCHNGVFDLNGRNIAGPPPRPLAPFRVHVLPPEVEGQPANLVVERV